MSELTPILQAEINPQFKELLDNHLDWVKENSKYSKKIEIKDEAEYSILADKLNYSKKTLKQISDRRLAMTAPIREIVKKIDDSVKSTFSDPLELINTGLNQSILEYKAEQIRLERVRIAEEKERIAKFEAEAKAKVPEMEEQIEATAQQALQVAEQAKPIEAQTKVKTTMGAMSVVSRFVFDPENSNILELCKHVVASPELAKYLQFNTVEINKNLKPLKDFTPPKVAGIEFKEEFSTRNT